MQKRVTVSLEDESPSIRQILDAGNCLDGNNLPRFDGYALGRTHVTFSGAIFAMGRSADLVRGAQCDSIGHPKTWSSDGIRDPGNAALACIRPGHNLASEDVDLISRCLGRVRNLLSERRIP